MKKLIVFMIVFSLIISVLGCAPAAAPAPAVTAAPAQNTSGSGSASAASPAAPQAPAGLQETQVGDVKVMLDPSYDYTKGAPVIIKYGHTNEPGSPLDLGVHQFSDALNTITNGRIKVEVYPSSQMGGNAEALEQLQLGSLEMCCAAVAMLGSFTDTTALLDLPFLFKNEQAAQAALSGEVGTEIFAGIEGAGFIGVAWFEDGFRQLTTNKEVHVPADLSGVKVRVMDNKNHIKIWTTLGASATPMAASEVYTALQNGTIDAQENALPTIESHRFQEVQKYIVMTRHIYAATPMLASKIWWDGLDKNDQTLILAVGAAARDWQVATNRARDKELFDKWDADPAITMVTLNDSEYQAWKDKVQSIYEENKDKLGAQIEKVNEINSKY